MGGWIIPSSTVPGRLDPRWPRPLHIARPPGLSPIALPRGRRAWLLASLPQLCLSQQGRRRRHRFPRGAMNSDSDEPATAARNGPAWRATIAAPSRRAVPAGAIGGCGQLDPRQGWVFACRAASRGRRASPLMTEWSNQQECACGCGRQRVPHADAFTTKHGGDGRHSRGMTLAVRAQSPSVACHYFLLLSFFII